MRRGPIASVDGGPDVQLAPNDALSLGLAIHELATNAAKYGALSVPGGRVDAVELASETTARFPGESRAGRRSIPPCGASAALAPT
jgi:two-component sensor histidine kinase